MTFRGTVINGVIVPGRGQDLPDGSRVSVNVLRKPTKRAPRRGKAPGRVVKGGSRTRGTRSGKADRIAAFASLAGIWRDRPEWQGMSSVQIAAELRRKAMERRRG
jgi:hypothetical protein